ncbi:uncharacterized protein LOC112905903 [Agrilus planipennis]|uniref:Uncharacterized protein LOC112905903 n=1 Tax=Agrilus planipennis TaxID=224129 RepID=A0A7F5RGE1_AGRPL|nr:uncharacterized protein LOC112905903 [Agrilus planipennis]
MFMGKCIAVVFLFAGVNLAVVISPEENLIMSKQERAIDARTMLSTFVGNLMSRSYSNGNGSQIISVNLTNLLVLILLKALIFAAGTLGVGSPGNNGCLQYVVCQNPQFAMKYKNAGDAILQTTKMLDLNADPRYEYIMGEVQEAIEWGEAKKECSRFECNPERQ